MEEFSHLNLNITCLSETDQAEILHIKEDENSGVKWFSLEEAIKVSTEPWMAEHIYRKPNQKFVSAK